MGNPPSPEVTAFALTLKAQPEVRQLMLAYVTMMLNHHRLCQQHHHPHPPLSLTELGQATQQIGALQVRVQEALAQVLFTTLQQVQFWHDWARWTLEQLDQWNDHPPTSCLTPGLLPLPGEHWSWKETVVIQAMALEAAHQLMDTLPPEALEGEALDQLLGLKDALVEDSSAVDPRGFERVSLGLPLLPDAAGTIAIAHPELDPTLKRLPLLSVRVYPQAALRVSAPQILGRWLAALAQQVGAPMAAVGLQLIAAMDEAAMPWQSASAVDGEMEMIRRVELLCQTRLQWQEYDLAQAQLHSLGSTVWRLEMSRISQDLKLVSLPAMGYEPGNLTAATVRVAPGGWCDRWIELYGMTVIDELLTLSDVARQILTLVDDPMAMRVAMAIACRMWQRDTEALTIQTLVMFGAPLEELTGNEGRWRRFCQDWTQVLARLNALGWQVAGGRVTPQMSWADLAQVSLSVQVVPQTTPLEGNTPRRTPPPPHLIAAGTSRGPMREISSQALAQALTIRGMSQAKLARSLALDRSTVNRWINGSRPIHPRYRPLLWELLGADLQEG